MNLLLQIFGIVNGGQDDEFISAESGNIGPFLQPSTGGTEGCT